MIFKKGVYHIKEGLRNKATMGITLYFSKYLYNFIYGVMRRKTKDGNIFSEDVKKRISKDFEEYLNVKYGINVMKGEIKTENDYIMDEMDELNNGSDNGVDENEC